MVSDYLGGWTLAVSGSLPDTTGRKNCGEIPLSRFAPDSGIVRAKFVKFVAKSYYISGPGLQHFNVVPFEKREGKYIVCPKRDIFHHILYRIQVQSAADHL